MNPVKVLIVDDDDDFRDMLAGWLTEEGYVVIQAETPIEATHKLFIEEPQIVFWDLCFPSLNNDEDRSLEIVGDICSQRPNLPAIILTNHARIDKAVQAIRDRGVYDFIEKSFDLDKLRVTLKNAQEKFDLSKRVEQLTGQVGLLAEALASKYPEIIGKSPAMMEVLHLIDKVANEDTTVLITGESGTGKELVASALHKKSARDGKPFIAVNCAAIPSELLEDELFGHKRGAFTGAIKDKKGRFEAAEGGTIFLDEIGDMPLALQVKLLRTIQEKKIDVIGDTKPTPVNVRIVAATNRNLEEEVAAGNFRQDLFFRLNVFPIRVPSLKERNRGDIQLLAEYFLHKCSQEKRREPTRIHPEAMRLLSQYTWPGNVRELENAIERAVILAENGEIQPKDLPQSLLPPQTKDDIYIPPIPLPTLETLAIRKALKRTNGNITRAAEMLGISRRTLQNKMRDLNLR